MDARDFGPYAKMPPKRDELLPGNQNNTKDKRQAHAVPFVGKATGDMRDLRNRLRVLAVFCAAGECKIVTTDLVAVNSFEASMHQVHVSEHDSSCGKC